MRLSLSALVACLTLAVSVSATSFQSGHSNHCPNGFLYKVNKRITYCITPRTEWGQPPRGTFCQKGWRYAKRLSDGTKVNRCLPTKDQHESDGCKCGEGFYKNDDGECVKYAPPSTCNPGSNWHWGGGKACGSDNECVPNDQPSHTTPDQPNGDCCPDGFRFMKSKQHRRLVCVPKTPEQPSCGGKPTCPKTHYWHGPSACCKKNKGRKRTADEIARGQVAFGEFDSELCPAKLISCPIKGGVSGSWECIDPKQELESCGGCTSLGQGRDCTQIKNANSVGCEDGTCQIFSCKAGHSLSSDKTACV